MLKEWRLEKLRIKVSNENLLNQLAVTSRFTLANRNQAPSFTTKILKRLLQHPTSLISLELLAYHNLPASVFKRSLPATAYALQVLRLEGDYMTPYGFTGLTLTEYHSLHTLFLSPALLLGNCNNDKSTYRCLELFVKNSLPPNLKSLKSDCSVPGDCCCVLEGTELALVRCLLDPVQRPVRTLRKLDLFWLDVVENTAGLQTLSEQSGVKLTIHPSCEAVED